MSPVFNATTLERDYAFIDDCPELLLQEIVTLPIGSLSERVAGILRWRKALLSGSLPPEDVWPPSSISGAARYALKEMNLPRFCREQPELVDMLLLDLLQSFQRESVELKGEVARQLAELERLERIRLEDLERALAKKARRRKRPVTIDEEALGHLRQSAAREAAKRQLKADQELLEAWGERARVWAEVADVFGDLGELMGRGWDLSQGILRHTGWQDLLRLRELLKTLPQIREIVQSLGRLRLSEDNESVAETIMASVRRLEEERLEIRTPLLPAETRGVERSGEIARMLPAEAAMLGHPKLRLLWHARRAERALMTYRVEGIQIERQWNERETLEEREETRPRPERGPILAIMDTSGSMHGLPERVAKALVLEALRTAHAEKRRCFLYSYSGPGQIEEHELSLSAEGIGSLLKFLSLSFGGGNDEAGVMARVVSRLKKNDWKKADVVFVSDGEWPAPSRLVRSVEEAREHGTRFHGVQIGNRGRTGLHAVCDPVHVFQDWAKLGGW